MVFDRTGMTSVYDIVPIAIDVGPSGPEVPVWPQITRQGAPTCPMPPSWSCSVLDGSVYTLTELVRVSCR
jgi:hypothetical protein